MRNELERIAKRILEAEAEEEFLNGLAELDKYLLEHPEEGYPFGLLDPGTPGDDCPSDFDEICYRAAKDGLEVLSEVQKEHIMKCCHCWRWMLYYRYQLDKDPTFEPLRPSREFEQGMEKLTETAWALIEKQRQIEDALQDVVTAATGGEGDLYRFGRVFGDFFARFVVAMARQTGYEEREAELIRTVAGKIAAELASIIRETISGDSSPEESACRLIEVIHLEFCGEVDLPEEEVSSVVALPEDVDENLLRWSQAFFIAQTARSIRVVAWGEGTERLRKMYRMYLEMLDKAGKISADCLVVYLLERQLLRELAVRVHREKETRELLKKAMEAVEKAYKVAKRMKDERMQAIVGVPYCEALYEFARGATDEELTELHLNRDTFEKELQSLKRELLNLATSTRDPIIQKSADIVAHYTNRLHIKPVGLIQCVLKVIDDIPYQVRERAPGESVATRYKDRPIPSEILDNLRADLERKAELMEGFREFYTSVGAA